MAIKRHLQHQKTSSFEYVLISKSDIPVNGVVTTQPTKPTSEELSSMVNPPTYIQVASHYYELRGKRPSTDTLYYGELAVSFCKGKETITIKNSDNKLIEFRPYTVEKACVKKIQLYNDELNNDGDYCQWKIPYATLTDSAISYNSAVVFLREVETGKQLIPDVTFEEDKILIKIYSDNTIPQKTYMAIIIGTSYEE